MKEKVARAIRNSDRVISDLIKDILDKSCNADEFSIALRASMSVIASHARDAINEISGY